MACVLPLSHVDEVMRPLPLEPLAGAPDFVRGVAVIRGEPLPVVDLAALLRQAEAGVPTRWVTLKFAERRLVLALEEVHGVITLDPTVFHPLPPLLSRLDPGIVAALGQLDRGLLLLLDGSRALPEEVWVQMDRRRYDTDAPERQ